MEIGDLSKPGEKKKLIGAVVLGLVAIIFLWWTFFGFGSSSPTTPTTPATTRATPPARRGTTPAAAPDQSAKLNELTSQLSVVKVTAVNTNVPEPRRNIFAFYEPPVKTEVVRNTHADSDPDSAAIACFSSAVERLRANRRFHVGSLRRQIYL